MDTHNTYLIVEEAFAGTRIDKFLASQLPDISRSRLQDWLSQDHILVNGKIPPSAHYKVRSGDTIHVTTPPLIEATPQPTEIPLNIVYEDDDIIVINKPVGMVVHPAPGHHDDTLVNALLAHCEDSLSGIGGVKRPGIVHRLDKDTSGLMVIAKHDQAHQHISDQFKFEKGTTLQRSYLALVWGEPNPMKGIIETGIARHPRNRQKMAVSNSAHAKQAITHYKTLQSWCINPKARSYISLVECTLETGRTHQIRVHLEHIKIPIVGDSIYGKKTISQGFREELRKFPRQALHAYKLGLKHPKTGEILKFEADPPEDIQNIIEILNSLY